MSERRLVGVCPVCDGQFRVSGLTCESCGSHLEGSFPLNRFAKLSEAQQHFVDVFITSRGNIKEVERLLGISYPTVRSRLDDVIQALGYPVQRGSGGGVDRKAVLEALDRGEISSEEALQRLKGAQEHNGGGGSGDE